MSISPQDIIQKASSGSGVKPKATKRGLNEMFKPQYTKVDSSLKDKKAQVDLESRGLDKVEPVKSVSQKPEKKKNKKHVDKSKVVLQECESSKTLSLKVAGSNVSATQFAVLMNLASQIYSHDFKLLSALFIKTDFGAIDNVTIDDQDMLEHGLRRGKELKNSRDNLERLGIISCKEAYKSEKANRKSFFYSLSSFEM